MADSMGRKRKSYLDSFKIEVARAALDKKAREEEILTSIGKNSWRWNS